MDEWMAETLEFGLMRLKGNAPANGDFELVCLCSPYKIVGKVVSASKANLRRLWVYGLKAE